MNHESLADLASRVEAGLVKALSIKQPYPHHIFHVRGAQGKTGQVRRRGDFSFCHVDLRGNNVPILF